MEDQKFLETMLKMLVNHPKDVKVKRVVDDRGVMLEVDINPDDLGSIIGQKGRNITAIRQLVRIIGLKNKAFISLKLNQPDK